MAHMSADLIIQPGEPAPTVTATQLTTQTSVRFTTADGYIALVMPPQMLYDALRDAAVRVSVEAGLTALLEERASRREIDRTLAQ